HVIAGKAIAFGEALAPEFKEYQTKLVKNCAVLADELMKRGIDLVSGGTDNHLLLLDLRSSGITGRELEARLDEVHITTNKNKIPNDPQTAKETSGLRLGTAAVTTRGFTEADMVEIAELIFLSIHDFDAQKQNIDSRAAALCAKYPLYK
ncbi:MAG: serine hydroxymethyltransferase, partial [Oscillospiraceae bacterium]